MKTKYLIALGVVGLLLLFAVGLLSAWPGEATEALMRGDQGLKQIVPPAAVAAPVVGGLILFRLILAGVSFVLHLLLVVLLGFMLFRYLRNRGEGKTPFSSLVGALKAATDNAIAKRDKLRAEALDIDDHLKGLFKGLSNIGEDKTNAKS